MRGGRDYDANFATRMKGSGVWAELVRQRFDKACARFGIGRGRLDLRQDLFRAPRSARAQLDLF
jgi:hypothetical protein